MTETTPRTAGQEWRAHWTLVLAGVIGFSMTAMASISLGIFTEPLEQAFGWSRKEVNSGFLAFAVTSLFLSPVFGHLIDRFGPRRVGLPGVALVGITFALFGASNGSMILWLLMWVLFTAATQASNPTIWIASVSSEFHTSRGLAIAITLAGSGLGSSFTPIYANYLIDTFGWRQAYVIMGLSWAGLVCVINYFFLWGRTDRARAAGHEDTPAATLSGMTVREGLRSATFFKLAGAAFFGTLLICAVMMQLVPMLSVGGLERQDAVWIASTIGIVSIAGKLICGALVDRMPGKAIAAIIFALPIITCFTLLTPSDNALTRLIPAIPLGLSVGGQIHMLPYLGTRYFGLRAYGTIMGFIGSIASIAIGLGPFLAGWVFDQTRSYDLVLIAGIPISIAAALLLLSLGRYPDAPAAVDSARPLGEPEPATAA